MYIYIYTHLLVLVRHGMEKNGLVVSTLLLRWSSGAPDVLQACFSTSEGISSKTCVCARQFMDKYERNIAKTWSIEADHIEGRSVGRSQVDGLQWWWRICLWRPWVCQRKGWQWHPPRPEESLSCHCCRWPLKAGVIADLLNCNGNTCGHLLSPLACPAHVATTRHVYCYSGGVSFELWLTRAMRCRRRGSKGQLHRKQNDSILPASSLPLRLSDHVMTVSNWWLEVMLASWSWITQATVRAKVITQLILDSAGPAILKTFLLELIGFRPIPVIYSAWRAKPENYWKR